MGDVEIMWPQTDTTTRKRSDRVPVVVEHADGSYSNTISQDGSDNHGVWSTIGTFTMSKGSSQTRLTVGTSAIPSSNSVAISQARFVLQSIAIDSTAYDGFTKHSLPSTKVCDTANP